MDAGAFSRQVTSFASLVGDARQNALRARLDHEPRCAVAHYLIACDLIDRLKPAPAVRHLMIAYHAEPEMQSAALLVFAGLDWVTRPKTQLLPVLLATWDEFRRPQFDKSRKERALFDAFDEERLTGLGALAQKLYRLPIRTLRVQIREATASRNAQLYPLLLSPA